MKTDFTPLIIVAVFYAAVIVTFVLNNIAKNHSNK